MSTLKADSVTASSGVNTALSLTGKGTGKVALGDAALTVPDTDGSANQYLRTTGSAALEFATLPAIPAEAFTGFRNLIINGDMAISQRGTTFAAVSLGDYTLDRWRWICSGTGVVTITQDTDVPTVAEAGTAFTSSLKMDVTTADASLASDDEYVIKQAIEGFISAHLGFGGADAATVTLSFWVKATKTGTWSGALGNGAYNRSYAFEYTINVADTWEYKTVTIVGDTTGTWVGATNGIGMNVWFPLALGSDYTGTAGTWEAANDQGSTNQVNGLDSTANNFYITGVQLEVGSSATDFERVPWDYQLSRCQRYFCKTFPYATAPAQNVGVLTGEVNFSSNRAASTANLQSPRVYPPVTMRAAPTITTYNPAAANAEIRDISASADCSAVGVDSASDGGFYIKGTSSASTAVGNNLGVHVAAKAEL